jgi:hypothetical protein
MRLLLSVIGAALALSGCGVVLGGCGGARTEIEGQSHVVYTATPPEPAALATKVPNGHCVPPTAADLSRELVPGTPCSIILSRYAGLPARSGAHLVGRVELRRSSLLRRLTREFNSLPPGVKGTIICPNDNGSEIVAGLRYPHREYLPLTITLSGCSGALREPVARSALGRLGGRLIGQLERLVAQGSGNHLHSN